MLSGNLKQLLGRNFFWGVGAGCVGCVGVKRGLMVFGVVFCEVSFGSIYFWRGNTMFKYVLVSLWGVSISS